LVLLFFLIEVVHLIFIFRNTDLVHSSQQNISMTLCVTILLVKDKFVEVYVKYVRNLFISFTVYGPVRNREFQTELITSAFQLWGFILLPINIDIICFVVM